MTHEEWCNAHRDIVDARNASVCANAKQLPSGIFGLCRLSIKGNTLFVNDTDFHNNIGKCLFEIPIKEIRIKKKSAFIFNRYLHFEYQGALFWFTDFGNAKFFLGVLDEETKINI